MTAEQARKDLQSRIKDVRRHAKQIEEVSPLLADAMYKETAFVEDGVEGLNKEEALLAMGRLFGLKYAKQVILEEWTRRDG